MSFLFKTLISKKSTDSFEEKVISQPRYIEIKEINAEERLSVVMRKLNQIILFSQSLSLWFGYIKDRGNHQGFIKAKRISATAIHPISEPTLLLNKALSGKVLYFDNPDGCSITISSYLPIGFACDFIQKSQGKLQLVNRNTPYTLFGFNSFERSQPGFCFSIVVLPNRRILVRQGLRVGAL